MITALRSGICVGGPIAGESRAAKGASFYVATKNLSDVEYESHRYFWDPECSCWQYEGKAA